MTMDLDSTVCEVHGYHKQGAAYGYTHTLVYHPLLASRADSDEVLHARQRSGRANTARGAARFVDELAARVRRAGASGELTMRMDSGFWSAKTIRACRRRHHHRIRYSITVATTASSPTGSAPRYGWTKIIAGTPRWSCASATSKPASACATAPRASSAPTPPGC